ncbi:MAG: hypothetical protein JWO50_731 [Candidatus Kaiserbacteria bacterium]|nr:hypothetical protein [Candidatus Kaiserbacteria bacterium]
MKKYLTSLFLALLFLSFRLPTSAYAAHLTVMLNPSVPAIGQKFTAEVHIATDNDAINAIEGSLSIPQNVSVDSVTTGGSVMTLWPDTPHFVVNTHTIDFLGGVQTGIAAHQDKILFSFTAHVAASGNITLSANKVVAYSDNGSGTPVAVQPFTQSISIESSTTATSSVLSDTTPPEFVTVEVGRDPSLFNNQYFLTFFAQDSGSGIAYYEVQEGSNEYVRADRYYVLLDQTRMSELRVRATDVAGNSVVKIIYSPQSSTQFVLIGGVILILLVIVFIWLQYRRKKYATL